jgi:DNA-binding CsgD family transcriptional regulator
MLSMPGILPFYAQLARTGLALLAVVRGDGAGAGDQYAALRRWTITVSSHNLACGHRVLGLLAHTMGNLDQAKVHFEDALAFCSKAGYRPELAWACHDYADTLLQRNGRGDREKAMSLLDESLSISTELGMRPLVERVAALQERAASQPAKTPAYPDGLTQREVEVLQLIAAGKTDREIAEELFISARTVGYHVGNILNKTTSSNRTEAATYAAQQGLL